ncbi:hypothetical protein BZG35_04395 [Brevundimonas sp. LM2]|uniref:DUF3667 domain-containing protein n=1 Tax=Brevundimonas sp. LM2 TaxID=1938605 RepID=UPI000983DA7C|nr:DUF3667 domain-containing protein [Brevundimonas sp. LM2]AQR60982.1 hypothetical protein BZG35_04395 [Brevundimonas sp. LM2]
MVDIEATGGLVTGGVIAGAIEKPSGHAGEAHAGTCSDCGQPVSGNFCAHCGQPTHVHRSLLHLGEELLHGVMHFDARIWRTLPLLLLNPGKLTREWIHGKRTRYVSPLAIFLFTVFLMFFALSFGGVEPIQSQSLDERIAEARTAVVESREALATVQAETPSDTPGRAGIVAGAQGAVTGAEATLRMLEEAKTAAPRADGLAPGSWQASVADSVHDGRVTIGIGDKKMKEKILHKLANPDFALYKIQQTAYKFAFLLIPLSIPFVWLLFAWKRGFTWYDHGVFVLYSLTFMAILTMAVGVFGRWDGWFPDTLVGLLMLSVPVHMFAQLKGTYGLSIFSALWRTAFLLLFCVFTITLFLAAIILMGLTG